jgi:hypothetical protein
MGRTAALRSLSEPRRGLLRTSALGERRREGYEYLSEFLIHRGFIGVGYDGGQNVRDEEDA